MAKVNSDDRVRRIWDRYAPRYDKEMRFWERVMFAGGREWVCTQATGETLEVAVGTGLNLPYYPTQVTLTGVDLSPAMLAVARERAAGLGRAVSLWEANAEQLPFDDGSFDTVVCTLALCSIPDDRAAIAQMYRVLRPGGRLLLLDHVAAPNPLLRLGLDAFARQAAGAGVDGVLALDLPIEEAGGFRETLASAGIDTIFLLSPTTTDSRLRRAAELGSGFLYGISRLGVTGARARVASGAEALVGRIRAHSAMPIALGFGISRPEHVAEVCAYADAAVVGSALVSVIAEGGGRPDLITRVEHYVQWLRGASARQK